MTVHNRSMGSKPIVTAQPNRPRGILGGVSERISGKSVSHLAVAEEGPLEIHFTDGARLVIEPGGPSLAVTLVPADTAAGGPHPTARQREYLDFISQYIRRFGVSPAESDIQRRFLVSAPSVNQMVQTLERRGFIARQPGVPRSIRIVKRPDRSLSA
jgi:repressor LexA